MGQNTFVANQIKEKVLKPIWEKKQQTGRDILHELHEQHLQQRFKFETSIKDETSHISGYTHSK